MYIVYIDRSGRLLRAEKGTTNSLESAVELSYDSLGRLSTAGLAMGAVLSGDIEQFYTTGYAYTVTQNLPLAQTVTYPTPGQNPRQVTRAYDGRSRLQAVYDEDNGGPSVQFSYDNGDRRTLAEMGNGAATGYVYDLANRLLSIKHASDVTSALSPDIGVPGLAWLEYGYDVAGNRTWKRDNVWTNHSERYEYDRLHRLVKFERGTLSTRNAQDPYEDPTTFTPYPDTDKPNRQLWRNEQSHEDPDAGLDRRGNWLSQAVRFGTAESTTTRTVPTAGAGGTGGKANEYGRVQLDIAGQTLDHYLSYDFAGNLRQIDIVGDLTCDGRVGEDDQDALVLLLSDPAAYAAAHPDCAAALGDVDGDNDVDGDDLDVFKNFIGLSTPRAERFIYDAENRLSIVYTAGFILRQQIYYDALGRRIFSVDYDSEGTYVKSTRHYYDGLAVVAEFECGPGTGQPNCGPTYAPALAREFLWGGGIGVPAGQSFPEPLAMIDHTAAGDLGAGVPETLYYAHDALGSVVGLLDDPVEANTPARLVERYDYDPYGTTYVSCRQGQTFVSCETSRYGNPFLWTAQRYDAAVGLYHFLFRTYSPTLGRWMQRDPLGYVDGVSLYQYCGSRATALVDPYGLLPPPGMGGEGGTWLPPIQPGGGPTGDACGGRLPPVPTDPRIPPAMPPATPRGWAQHTLYGAYLMGFSMELWPLWLHAMRHLGDDNWWESFERFMQAYMAWLKWKKENGSGSFGITSLIYTGDPYAPDELTDDATEGAGKWLHDNSWVRGGFVGVGTRNNRGVTAAIGASWSIDSGVAFYGTVAVQWSRRGRDPSTGRFQSVTGGLGYTASYGEQGASGGFFGAGGANQKAHGGGAGMGQDGSVAVGGSAGYLQGGLFVDPSKLLPP